MKLKRKFSGALAMLMLATSIGNVYASEQVSNNIVDDVIPYSQTQSNIMSSSNEEGLVDCDIVMDEYESVIEENQALEVSVVQDDIITSDAALSDESTSGGALSTAASETNFFEYYAKDKNGVDYTITLNYRYGDKFYGMTNVAQVHVVSKMPVCEIDVPDKVTINIDGIDTEVTVVSIAESAFEGSKATKVTVPQTVFEIGNRAFANCTNLKEISINTTYKAKNGDFIAGDGYYNKNYKDTSKDVQYAHIPSSIGEYAFTGDVALETVYISGIQKFGKYLFDGCTSLDNPQFNIDGMYEYNTDGTFKTNNLTMTADVNMFENCSGMRTITFPRWFKSIGAKAFSGCTDLNNVTFGTSMGGNINVETFLNCPNLESINVVGSEADPSYENKDNNLWNTTYRSLDGVLYKTDTVQVFNDDGTAALTIEGDRRYKFVEKTLVVYPVAKKDKVFNAPTTLTGINNDAVSNNLYLEKVVIDTAPNISWVNGLKTETPVIVSLGNNSFKNDSNLKSLTINNTCKIGNNAFENCVDLTELIYNSNDSEMGSYAFANCAFSELVLDGWNRIGNNAFEKNNSLTKVTMLREVYVLGDRIFNECISLLKIDISAVGKGGDMSGSIGTYLLQNCTALTEAVWSDIVDGYSTGSFSGCTNLRTVTMANTGDNAISLISNNVFENCTSLYSIPYSRFLVTIDNNAFVNCTSFSTISLSRSTVNIKDKAFNVMSPNFVIECVKGSLTDDFATARGASIVYRADDIIDEEFLMFDWVSVTKEVYDKSLDVYKMSIQEGNTTKYYRWELTGYRGGFDRLKVSGYNLIYMSNNWINNPFGVSSTTKNANNMKPYLKGVKLYGVYAIGNNAFNGASKLVTVVFDDTLTAIGDNAFSGCGMLNNSYDWSVTDESRAWTGELVPPTGDDLLEVKFDKEATFVLSKGAFQTCRNISRISLPSTIKSIEINTFNNCSGLVEITIPTECTVINNDAFTGCTALIDINFNIKLERICERAFSNCTALKMITFQQNVFLEKDIFRGCKSVEKIVTPHTINMVYERDPFPDTKTCVAICAANSQGYEYAVKKGFDIQLAEFLDGLYTVTKAFVYIPEGLTVVADKVNDPGNEVTLSNGDYLVGGDKYKVSVAKVDEKIAIVTANGNSIDEDTWYTVDDGLTEMKYNLIYIDAMLVGDADCDGQITATDSSMVLQYVLNSAAITFSESVIRGVDVDGDGVVTATDSSEINQKALDSNYVYSGKNA